MSMSTTNKIATRCVAQALPRLANNCVRAFCDGQATQRDHELYQPSGFIEMT